MGLLGIVAGLAAAVSVVLGNSITFINQDERERTINFTPSVGHPAVASFTIGPHETYKLAMPDAWVGNFHTTTAETANQPGFMLGEVTFGGYRNLQYFDVSAIVNPNDVESVQLMFPLSQLGANPRVQTSGCEHYMCDNCYQHADDIRTVATDETDLVATLGRKSSADVHRRDDKEEAQARAVAKTQFVGRKYVLGRF